MVKLMIEATQDTFIIKIQFYKNRKAKKIEILMKNGFGPMFLSQNSMQISNPGSESIETGPNTKEMEIFIKNRFFPKRIKFFLHKKYR